MKKKGVKNASVLYTGQGLRKKQGRHVEQRDLGGVENGAIVYSQKEIDGHLVPDEVLWVGESTSIPAEFQSISWEDLNGKNCITPGWIDCHTHLVYGGDRSNEFAMRCAGATYEEIAKAGGGILSTLRPTREASLDTLYSQALERLNTFWRYGVRAIEIKSGYGLSHEAEIKSLEVIQRLKKENPWCEIQATYLGAHAYPIDRKKSDYLTEILDKTLPEVSERKLADACDVFIDEGFFSLEEGKKILEKAKSLGLKIKLHGDELANTNSTALACELGALSVDHLLRISKENIRKLSDSETVGVLLPATSFFIKEPYAPARKLIDSGARIALSTDSNPGSSMCLSLPFVMTLAGLYYQLSCAEILCGVTFNAAKALGWEERLGTLEKGKKALYTVLPFESFEQCYYQMGWIPR